MNNNLFPLLHPTHAVTVLKTLLGVAVRFTRPAQQLLDAPQNRYSWQQREKLRCPCQNSNPGQPELVKR